MAHPKRPILILLLTMACGPLAAQRTTQQTQDATQNVTQDTQNATPNAGRNPAATVKYTKDSLQTVKKLVERKKAIVLDVRSKPEWDAAHLKIAHFIPMDIIRNPEKCAVAVKKLKKETVVYVHCKRGARAKVCAAVLSKMGFDARPLKANYEDLGKAGFEEVIAP